MGFSVPIAPDIRARVFTRRAHFFGHALRGSTSVQVDTSEFRPACEDSGNMLLSVIDTKGHTR